MDGYDVMLYWDHGGVPDHVKSAFKRPTKFVSLGPLTNKPSKMGWPHPLKYIQHNVLGGIRPLRVGVLGFSASCAGLGEMLRSADATYIDTIVAIDGIACEAVPYPAVRGGYLGPYVAFGKLAAFGAPTNGDIPQGSRCLVITNSQANGPKGMEPTSVTTLEIEDKVLGAGVTVPSDLIPSAFYGDTEYHPWTNPAGTITWANGSKTTFAQSTFTKPPEEHFNRRGDFWVFSSSKVDPTSIGDHRYQAAVMLPMVLKHIVAERWNRLEPGAGTCVVV